MKTNGISIGQLFFQFTGSQESILQLDLDMEEADLYVRPGDHGPRRNSVSPLPQIRPSEHRISIDSESDNEVSSPNEQTPISQQKMPCTTTSTLNKHDVCVGCIAAAFANKKQQMDDDNVSEYRFGHSSLPSTLRKNRGNSSNNSHYHTHHHHLTEAHDKCNKKGGRRAPLANLTQSISMHCDNLLKNAAEFSSIRNDFKEFKESKEARESKGVVADLHDDKEEEAKSCDAEQSSKNNF